MSEPRQISIKRREKIKQVLNKRQKDLTLVLDNIYDPHNASAIFRSCDAFGVGKVFLYYSTEKFPSLGRKSSASAKKWVEQEKFSKPDLLLDKLKENNFQILGTGFSKDSQNLHQCDLTKPTAVVVGNEHRGVSPEIRTGLTEEIHIPMQGMVPSFNVSVSAAIILYEAWRQREALGMYSRPSYSFNELEELYMNWCSK